MGCRALNRLQAGGAVTISDQRWVAHRLCLIVPESWPPLLPRHQIGDRLAERPTICSRNRTALTVQPGLGEHLVSL
jgi:hypothetical protein